MRCSAWRLVEYGVKQYAELVVLSIEAAHVRGEAPLVVEMPPGDAMSGFSGELTQERTQATRVALPERMHRVHLGVVMR